MNVAGLVIIAIGIVFLIVALRGTQASVFPWFFGSSKKS